MNPTQSKKLVTFLVVAAALLVLPLILQQGGNAWVRIVDMKKTARLLASREGRVRGRMFIGLLLQKVGCLPSCPAWCMRLQHLYLPDMAARRPRRVAA